MSAVAERTRSERRESASSGGPLTGTGRLLRFTLRRDRVRSPRLGARGEHHGGVLLERDRPGDG